MSIPTEPIDRIPRPQVIFDGSQAFKDGRISQRELDSLYDSAIRDTIKRFEAAGSPVITDGEAAARWSFWPRSRIIRFTISQWKKFEDIRV